MITKIFAKKTKTKEQNRDKRKSSAIETTIPEEPNISQNENDELLSKNTKNESNPQLSKNDTLNPKKNNTKKVHKRYDSSVPVEDEDLGFEDPDVKLHFERLKIKDLQHELERKLDELYATQKKF